MSGKEWGELAQRVEDLGYSTLTMPDHFGNQMAPMPELAGYRVLLTNVYCCSSNMHSGSGIGRGSSYNCWRTIADDLAL